VLASKARAGKRGELAGARRLEPDPESPELPPSSPLRPVDRMVKLREHFAGIRQQYLAGRSQFHTPAITTKEPGADLRFEAADGLTQG
jgi:hypothetical protein